MRSAAGLSTGPYYFSVIASPLRSSASGGCEVIVDNLDGLCHSDSCDSHLFFFFP